MSRFIMVLGIKLTFEEAVKICGIPTTRKEIYDFAREYDISWSSSYQYDEEQDNPYTLEELKDDMFVYHIGFINEIADRFECKEHKIVEVNGKTVHIYPEMKVFCDVENELFLGYDLLDTETTGTTVESLKQFLGFPNNENAFVHSVCIES